MRTVTRNRDEVLPSDRSDSALAWFTSRGRPLRIPPWVASLVETLAFWGAIALPVCYLSLLVVGIDDTSGLLTFLGLVGLHVVALIAGRSHRADSSR